jgi:large subunit ribosomal protein L25
MAQQQELEVQQRDVLGKATKRLRKSGLIPANIYGHKEPSQALQIDAIAFERLRRAHGMHGVLSLKLPDGFQNVLISQIQRSPTSGAILHVDFTRVSMSDRITLKVALHFVGEAPGVQIGGGVFLHLLDALEVECRASDLVDSLDVDISILSEVNSSLHAKDVKLPADFSLITDPEETIAKIDAPRGAAETPATPEPTPAPEAASNES